MNKSVSHEENLRRISKLSKIMKWISRILAIVLPVLVSLPWLFGDQTTIAYHTRLDSDMLDLNWLDRFWGVTLVIGTTLIASFGLFVLARLFYRFQNGDFFEVATVTHLKLFGQAIFLFGIAKTLAATAMLPILTDGKFFVIAINLSDLMIMLIGGAFWIASWVMLVGKHLSDEMADVI
ncbi:MAG: DUF2975 domain-containing protein [Aquisalinus sp.]|nr:DUF2975 domain-containing protein [Aquisalinus sp.]